MNGRWFRWLWVLLMLNGLWPSAFVRAQGEIRLSALTIELWPEYDQPNMLVILRGTLAPDVTLPASVTVRIPTRTNGPHAVAVQDANGLLANTQFVTTPQGEETLVTLQATLPSFQVEYYDVALKIEGETRSYALAWTSDYSVAAATLRVQEPVSAQNLAGEPPLVLAGTSDLGVSYYTASLGALRAGQAVTANLNYSKPNAQLSVEQGAAQQPVASLATPPVLAAQPNANGEAQLQMILAGALLAVSVALIGLGFLFWRRTRTLSAKKPAGVRGRPSIPPRPQPTTQAQPASTKKFCTQCGQAVQPEDRFCRYCGSAVRAG